MLARPTRARSPNGVVHHEVTLNYPSSWAIRPSPHAAAMERRTLEWLRARGVVHDQETSERFERLSVGEYANWPFALATRARAEVITKFLALWIFYDDAIEEADDTQGQAIHDAIRASSPTPPTGDRHLACWWEIARQYGGTMSRAWLDRHAERFTEWMASVAAERATAVEFRATGRYPSPEQHLAGRRLNIGMIPNMDFVEYQMGWELPSEVLSDPAMREVERCGAEAVAIINDVFGYSKDRGSHWPNLVSCLVAAGEHGPEQAFQRVCAMHDERVALLLQHERDLTAKYAHRRELADWFAGLHCVVYGFAQWHSRAPRYSATHLVGDRVIRVRVRDDGSAVHRRGA